MDFLIRAATPTERSYTYSESKPIMEQTGCIGHLRGDMGSNDKGFYTSWDDHIGDLKTADFKAEIDDVVNAMRFDPQYGGILKDRSSLAAYCYRCPESSFGNSREYGFRADTEQYSYLMRLNPNRGEYNLYIYCYRRDYLDRHLKQAEKGIRFIDSNNKELFRIPDGDKIRIIRDDGTHSDKTCRYIDETHVEIGGLWGSVYQLCEFAEQMEQSGNKVIPLRSSLPEQCYVFLETTSEIGIVKKGEKGYYRTDLATGNRDDNREVVNEANKRAGLTQGQVQAMLSGSMFGWQHPAADPKNYDEDGKPIKPKQKDRGDAR